MNPDDLNRRKPDRAFFSMFESDFHMVPPFVMMVV
jgi:hypothetical protein